MQTAIGVKMVKFKAMTRQEYCDYRGWKLPPDENGADAGMLVEYVNSPTRNHPDHEGYISWSPAKEFDDAYFPLSEGNKISPADVATFTGEMAATQVDAKTTLVKTTSPTGFVLYETSSCVDPDNFDMAIGTNIGVSRCQDKLWFALGFVLQWAKNGLKKGE